MARKKDIQTAFTESIKIASNGRRTIKTVDFVERLASYGHDWSLSEANRLDRLLQANLARYKQPRRG